MGFQKNQVFPLATPADIEDVKLHDGQTVTLQLSRGQALLNHKLVVHYLVNVDVEGGRRILYLSPRNASESELDKLVRPIKDFLINQGIYRARKSLAQALHDWVTEDEGNLLSELFFQEAVLLGGAFIGNLLPQKSSSVYRDIDTNEIIIDGRITPNNIVSLTRTTEALVYYRKNRGKKILFRVNAGQALYDKRGFIREMTARFSGNVWEYYALLHKETPEDKVAKFFEERSPEMLSLALGHITGMPVGLADKFTGYVIGEQPLSIVKTPIEKFRKRWIRSYVYFAGSTSLPSDISPLTLKEGLHTAKQPWARRGVPPRFLERAQISYRRFVQGFWNTVSFLLGLAMLVGWSYAMYQEVFVDDVSPVQPNQRYWAGLEIKQIPDYYIFPTYSDEEIRASREKGPVHVVEYLFFIFVLETVVRIPTVVVTFTKFSIPFIGFYLLWRSPNRKRSMVRWFFFLIVLPTIVGEILVWVQFYRLVELTMHFGPMA